VDTVSKTATILVGAEDTVILKSSYLPEVDVVTDWYDETPLVKVMRDPLVSEVEAAEPAITGIIASRKNPTMSKPFNFVIKINSKFFRNSRFSYLIKN
jgi:hypothetical protein